MSDRLAVQNSVVDELDHEPVVDGLDREPAKKKSVLKKIAGILWDTLDESSKEEQRLVLKLDSIFLAWACFYYFVMYLDSTNVSNAYVSGMQQDLGLYGDQLNWLNTYRTIGYIIGTMPSQFILMRVRPSLFLPCLELVWSLFVLGMGFAKNVETMYGLRFMIGLCESAAYPGMMTLLGSWYTPRELAKRSVIYQQSSAVAQMFSGFLQAGIYHGLDGASGRPGWRWLFIFDFIIGAPIAILGFIIIPDSPTNTRAFWLKPTDRAVALERMERQGRAPPAKLTWQKIFKFCTDWPIVFLVPYICFVTALDIAAFMNLWLKSLDKYSVEKINEIPTGGYALEIVSALIFAIYADYTGQRWVVITAAGLLGMIGGIILSAQSSNVSATFAGWYFTFMPVGAGAVLFAWVNELCQSNAEQRGFMIGLLNTIAYVFSAFLPLLIYPSSKAPKYPVGYKVNAVFWVIFALGGPVGWFLAKRYPRESTKGVVAEASSDISHDDGNDKNATTTDIEGGEKFIPPMN
jgi:MFS transporter, ACS family, pantothenate transporter